MDRIQPQPLAQALQARPQPRFGNALMTGIDVASRYLGVDWLAQHVYSQGDHLRYAFEQTAGLTVPRTVQQLYRTHAVTGKKNKIAAIEMFIRDLAADFTDTFLPGILATLVIGKFLDRRGDRVVRFNMGRDAVDFYHAMAQGAGEPGISYATFLNNLEDVLRTSTTPQITGTSGRAQPFTLKALLTEIEKAPSHWLLKKSEAIQQAGATLAGRLGLPDTDLVLKFQHGGQAHSLELSATDLMRDLWQMRTLAAETMHSPEWGKTVAQILQKTRKAMPRQMWANGVALAGSLSIPFLIRLMTRHFYGGQDAFPGTKAIADHFEGSTPPATAALNTAPENVEKTKKDFKWFPYLHQAQKDGNWWPTVISGVFFGALFAIPYYRHFLSKKLPLTLKNIAKVYEFERGFPWTTVTQMEVTYGLLCGIRLLSSRDRAEFREAATRDCLMGWPALTYFFPWANGQLAKLFNNQAMPGLKDLPLLVKRNGDPRPRQEITEALLKNLDLGGREATAVAKRVQAYQGRLTVMVAAVSMALISLLVPQLNIWATNREEVEKRQGKSKPRTLPTAMGSEPAQVPNLAVPAVVSLNHGPAANPSPWVMGPVPAWIPVQSVQAAPAFLNTSLRPVLPAPQLLS